MNSRQGDRNSDSQMGATSSNTVVAPGNGVDDVSGVDAACCCGDWNLVSANTQQDSVEFHCCKGSGTSGGGGRREGRDEPRGRPTAMSELRLTESLSSSISSASVFVSEVSCEPRDVTHGLMYPIQRTVMKLLLSAKRKNRKFKEIAEH